MADTKRVIALGFFDGVHSRTCRAHEDDEAAGRGARGYPGCLTFDTHPDTLVKGVEVPLINSPEGRAEIIRRVYGIDSVIFIHFNRAVMQMPWEDFLRSLVDELHAVHVVVGYDFSCGYRGDGRALNIAGWCSRHGLGCDIIDAVKIDGEVVSSTRIRSLIQDGDMEEANRLLGHPHCLVGHRALRLPARGQTRHADDKHALCRGRARAEARRGTPQRCFLTTARSTWP